MRWGLFSVKRCMYKPQKENTRHSSGLGPHMNNQACRYFHNNLGNLHLAWELAIKEILLSLLGMTMVLWLRKKISQFLVITIV